MKIRGLVTFVGTIIMFGGFALLGIELVGLVNSSAVPIETYAMNNWGEILLSVFMVILGTIMLQDFDEMEI